MTFAFTFDAAFCSGCKACQAACKDKNNLPLGVLWRRVYEVSGGSWQKAGAAWNNTVFAYNLSIACNHCIHPKCAGLCPANAYTVREDGIVILHTSKCIGCGYCAWACPYGAPQYNTEAGHMTKCNFCYDNLDQGLPPACVAACPMRVLDYVEVSEGTVPVINEIRLWDAPPALHPYPLPNYSRTQPRVAIKPHPAMNRMEKKSVANFEEIRPHMAYFWEDLPLILFTLFTQMAVGGFWSILWTFPRIWLSTGPKMTLLQLLPLLLTGLCLGAGLLASFAHLGTKKKALYALRNLRRSWLSREVLFTGLFGIGWLFTTLEIVIWHRSPIEVMAFAATFGIGLVYSMAQVYRLRTVRAWNTGWTNLGFLVSALLLGQMIMAVLLAYQSSVANKQWIAISAMILLLLLTQLAITQKSISGSPLQGVRIGLILVAMIACAIGLFSTHFQLAWLTLFTSPFVLAEEALGRWLFYRSRA